MKSTRPLKRPGFTLVELLVVIVIIATLAALSLTIGPKMMAKAKATEAMNNIRQIGPMLHGYAADHAGRFPAASAKVAQADGSLLDQQWNEAVLANQNPGVDPTEFKTRNWWDKNKSPLRNPMFKESARPRGWAPLNPGFALNAMIAQNVMANQSPPEGGDPLEYAVPVTMIPAQERTPLIAPYDHWVYRYDGVELMSANRGTLKDLLIEGKAIVLFVDGHLENITPKEYTQRRLTQFPEVTNAGGF
jgi:prepilin-type N-terminal cleavage/methylation domain-containing protein/prepilin-type processing-associated H-X9-DG protein